MVKMAPGKFFEADYTDNVASLLIGGYSGSTGESALWTVISRGVQKLNIFSAPGHSIADGNGVAVYNQPNSEVLRRYRVLDIDSPGSLPPFSPMATINC